MRLDDHRWRFDPNAYGLSASPPGRDPPRLADDGKPRQRSPPSSGIPGGRTQGRLLEKAAPYRPHPVRSPRLQSPSCPTHRTGHRIVYLAGEDHSLMQPVSGRWERRELRLDRVSVSARSQTSVVRAVRFRTPWSDLPKVASSRSGTPLPRVPEAPPASDDLTHR